MAGNNIARATNGTHSIINYTLFVGVWWLFTLLYFLPTAFIDKFAIPIVDMVLDGLSVLFSFCAAVALPAYLGAHSCSNRVRYICNWLIALDLTDFQNYTLHNGVTNSSPSLEQNCRQAQTATAFLWFGWAAFVATLVVSAMAGKGSGANLRGGIRRGGPSMSQV